MKEWQTTMLTRKICIKVIRVVVFFGIRTNAQFYNHAEKHFCWTGLKIVRDGWNSFDFSELKHFKKLL